MKPLTEHADFVEFIRAAAAESGLLPALVLKDYWVTRILRPFAGDPEFQGKMLWTSTCCSPARVWAACRKAAGSGT